MLLESGTICCQIWIDVVNVGAVQHSWLCIAELFRVECGYLLATMVVGIQSSQFYTKNSCLNFV